MNFRFKRETLFDLRKQEADIIRDKYPDRVPVVVELAPKSQIPDIDKHKFLVPNDITIAQFIGVIRQRTRLTPSQGIFLFVNQTIPLTSATMGQIYAEHKDEDGFLYIVYAGENIMG